WVSPPHLRTSQIVALAAIMAQAASTALPPWRKMRAPAVLASGLPATATQCRPCSTGLTVSACVGWPDASSSRTSNPPQASTPRDLQERGRIDRLRAAAISHLAPWALRILLRRASPQAAGPPGRVRLLALHRGQRLLAGRFELIARQPLGQGRRIGDVQPDPEAELRILDHAFEVPAVVQFVGGLVVLIGLVLLDARLAPARRATDEVGARLEIHRGHTDAREVELVGTIEVAPIGERIRRDDATLLGGECLDDRIERGLAHADERHVAGAPPDVRAVVIDVGGDA